MRGSHKMAIKRVLIAIKGGGEMKKGKKRGVGEGKDIVATRVLLVAT